MRKSLFPATILPALFLALCGISVQAQVKSEFSIKKIEPALVETPQISAGTYRKQQPGAARPTPWLEVDVNFERDEVSKEASKFSDDLTVNFYVLLNNAAISEDKQSTLLTGSTTISDVPYGKGLHVAAFVAPQTLARYFDGKAPTNIQQAIIDAGVTISDSSGVVAISSFKSAEVAKQGKGWWESESGMTKVSGRVLEKSQTPFAPLAWDYYLPSKSKAAN
jgi:hypothetical protein